MKEVHYLELGFSENRLNKFFFTIFFTKYKLIVNQKLVNNEFKRKIIIIKIKLNDPNIALHAYTHTDYT